MTFAIENTNGKHLGFLLMESGDCIFRSLPFESELFESPESEVLTLLAEIGEFQYQEVEDKLMLSHSALTENIVIETNSFKVNGETFIAKQISK